METATTPDTEICVTFDTGMILRIGENHLTTVADKKMLGETVTWDVFCKKATKALIVAVANRRIDTLISKLAKPQPLPKREISYPFHLARTQVVLDKFEMKMPEQMQMNTRFRIYPGGELVIDVKRAYYKAYRGICQSWISDWQKAVKATGNYNWVTKGGRPGLIKAA